LIMLVAMMGDLGTHYDAAPRNFPSMGPWGKWMVLGLFPQATYWLGFTVVMGMLFGVVAVAALPRPVRSWDRVVPSATGKGQAEADLAG